MSPVQTSWIQLPDEFRSQYLNDVFDSSSAGLLLISDQGAILRVNQSFCEMLGYDRDQVMGSQVQERLFSEESTLYFSKNAFFEAEFIHQKGYRVPVQINSSVYRKAELPSALISLQVVDISDRKKAELEKDWLSGIIATQQEMTALSTKPDEMMQFLAKKTREMIHADNTVIEIVDKHEIVILAGAGEGEKLIGVHYPIKDTLTGLCSTTGEVLYSADSETDTRVNREVARKVNARSIVVVPLRRENVIVGVLKAYSAKPNAYSENDLTTLQLLTGFFGASASTAFEFKEKRAAIEAHEALETELRHANELAGEAIKAKSEFLATMSHEIRNPLNGVLGMTELLLETPLSEEQKDLTSTIRTSGKALLAIVNDILDLSKIESGKMDVEEIEFELALLLKSLERSIGIQAKQKGLNFFISSPPDAETLKFRGDPNRIAQVLNNLLMNALKFTQKGHVALEVTLKAKADPLVEIGFEIIDTGIGISPFMMPKLFQSFQQVDSSTSRKFGGSGLGLVICKKLVSMMNGTIEVYSREKTGSTFIVKIPVKRALAASEHAAQAVAELKPQVPLEPGQSPHAGLKVLVVDDHVENQKLLVKLLNKVGIEPETASTGKEALKLVFDIQATRPYDLILMDCHMPELDGYETTRLIRTCGQLSVESVPIIAVSASAIPEEKNKCFAVGMNDFVSKPVLKAPLFYAIETVLKIKLSR